MGKLRPYFTEFARGAAECRAERLCREECCRGLQRCAPEVCNREVLQRSATERDAEDYCRGSLQRSATEGPRMQGSLQRGAAGSAAEGRCNRVL